MSGIVICPMCGAQTEATKKFCPVCGATITPSSGGSFSSSATPNDTPKVDAASTLFSRLQDKKPVEEPKHKDTAHSSHVHKPASPAADKKERPKTFKTKPLGVAEPEKMVTTGKTIDMTPEVKTHLIQFLGGLNKLDKNLEASAVVRRDGSLLASAHSSRVKPEMMATITSALFGIAQDSIRAISGGKMRIITINAEQVILMLRPINEETILLLVTGPNSNIGLITMKSELVAQNIAAFLAKGM